MQKETKNIDKLFHDTFKDFEKEPPLYTWDKLNVDLDKKVMKKRIIYFYRIAASVAIILSFLSGYYISSYYKNNTSNFTAHKIFQNNNRNTIKNNNPVFIKRDTYDSSVYPPQAEIEKSTPESYQIKSVPDKYNRKSSIRENDSSKNINKSNIGLDTNVKYNDSNEITSVKNIDTLIKKNNILPENISILQKDKEDDKSNKDSISQKFPENMILQKENNHPIVLNNMKSGKWSVEAQVSPSYSYNNSSYRESSIDNYKDKAIITYSGGVKIDFNGNGKYSFDAGILYSNLGIKNVYSAISV
ncbi:MAG: hypothetical protein HGB12_17800, partial [Bacteroidetes bacterium]|nr:hypothetical protein [Bacteroidota bacterium]